MFDLNSTIDLDINEVENFCKQELPNILIGNCSDFAIAAFILQTVLEKINEIRAEEN